MKIYIKETNRVNEFLELEWKFREFIFKINFRELMKNLLSTFRLESVVKWK
jgi:hypothetical protein